jgi:hypothetical protein
MVTAFNCRGADAFVIDVGGATNGVICAAFLLSGTIWLLNKAIIHTISERAVTDSNHNGRNLGIGRSLTLNVLSNWLPAQGQSVVCQRPENSDQLRSWNLLSLGFITIAFLHQESFSSCSFFQPLSLQFLSEVQRRGEMDAKVGASMEVNLAYTFDCFSFLTMSFFPFPTILHALELDARRCIT